MSKYREDKIELLLPTMQKRVSAVMGAMRDLGYEPVLFDGLRTAEEAVANSKKGTGVVQSMHLFGCAADLICEEHGWSCRAQKCKFYQNLKRQAAMRGFVCGADFSSVDEPHIQACFIADQATMRALGTAEKSAAAREKKVAAFFALRDAAAILAATSTKETIAHFQLLAGLKADGVRGPKTEAALKRALRAL